MKAFTILVVGLAVGWAVPVSAHEFQGDAFHRAELAHALAAELASLTLPHSRCTAAWSRIARRAVEADTAAEAVIAGLTTGDFCSARDAADHLKALADDLQDDAEELDPVLTPFAGGPCRDDVRRVEHLADELEDVAGDLHRDVRRLDEARFVGRPVGRPFCGTPVPVCPSAPAYDVLPGRPARPYDGGYYGIPSRGYDSGNGYRYDGALGPSLTVPPSDMFGPVPTEVPGGTTPVPDGGSYRGYAPAAEADARPLPPGLAKKKLPPGHAKKAERRQPAGPALLPPSASLGRGGYVR
ncbi:MAG TPA: hypothetical protein VF170_11165 [Planctomycetaceae bacterium]